MLAMAAGKLEGASKMESEAKEKARQVAQDADDLKRQRQQLVRLRGRQTLFAKRCETSS